MGNKIIGSTKYFSNHCFENNLKKGLNYISKRLLHLVKNQIIIKNDQKVTEAIFPLLYV